MERGDSLPDDPDRLAARKKQLADWWNSLHLGGNPGASTWEVLDGIERQVSDCLYGDHADISRAESLTAEAMHLVAGHEIA